MLGARHCCRIDLKTVARLLFLLLDPLLWVRRGIRVWCWLTGYDPVFIVEQGKCYVRRTVAATRLVLRTG